MRQFVLKFSYTCTFFSFRGLISHLWLGHVWATYNSCTQSYNSLIIHATVQQCKSQLYGSPMIKCTHLYDNMAGCVWRIFSSAALHKKHKWDHKRELHNSEPKSLSIWRGIFFLLWSLWVLIQAWLIIIWLETCKLDISKTNEITARYHWPAFWTGYEHWPRQT